jgi:DNA polymerase type B, organellar and viral
MARGRKIYVLDAETDPFLAGRIPEPFLWGLFDGENYEEFTETSAVVARLEREKAVVYAHNGGRFDYHYLRDYINSDDPIMLIGGRLAKFRIGECEFRDSMNLFTFALEAYQKEKIDYALFEAGRRDDPNIRAAISRYLRSDCTNLYELVQKFFTDYGRSLTQAGSAMRVWSKKSGISPPRQTVGQYARFKPYYFGGRVQCFEHGVRDCNFSVVDINSAYPFAMLFPHPFSTNAELVDYMPAAGEWGRYFIRFSGISRGALPFIETDGGTVRKLTFPNDESEVREYCVTGWELEAALETNSVKIIKIIELWRFATVLDFTSYVNHFYNLRLTAKAEGDKARDLFAKIFLNALYGKFGANPDNYREYIVTHGDSLPEYLAENWQESAQWGERTLIERPLPEEKQRYYNIATAASITGYVRAHLWRSLAKCGSPIYCDTDSIAAADVRGLGIGNNLGDWKIELQCDRYAVAGKKLYAFRASGSGEYKTACKGAKLTPQEIERIAAGETITYRPEVPTYSAHHNGPRFINREIRSTF